MKLITLCLLAVMIVTNHQLEFDFGSKKNGNDWNIINDGVMGGLSKGNIQFTNNSLKFSGDVSLENNGGFSSLKSPFHSFDLSSAKKVEIKYRSVGHGIAVTLENSRQFYRPYYKLYLKETQGKWETLKVDIDEFKEYRLGRSIGRSVSTEILSSIRRIGFITSDKKEGSFEIEVDYLKFE